MDVDQSWEAIPNRGYAAAEKKKRIFLKRGEGVQRRVLAPMSRKIRPMKDSDDKSGKEGNDLSWQGDKGRPVHGLASQHGSRKMTSEKETRSLIEDDLDELAAESSLIDVDTERDTGGWTWPASKPVSTPHHVRALQHGLDDRDEDEELDEFQALEAQITKDVGTSLKPGPSSRLAGNPFAHGVSQRGTYKQVPASSHYVEGDDDDDDEDDEGGFSFPSSKAGRAHDWDEPAMMPTRDASESAHYQGPNPLAFWAPSEARQAEFKGSAGPGRGSHASGYAPPQGPAEVVPGLRSQQHMQTPKPQQDDEWDDDRSFDPQCFPPPSHRQGQQSASGGGTVHRQSHEPRSPSDDEEDCYGGDSSLENGRPGLTQPFVRSLFSKQQQGKGRHSEGKASNSRGAGSKAQSPVAPSPGEVERMAKLEEELIKIQHEKSSLVKMRTELEKAANRLEQERIASDRRQAEELAKVEEWRASEAQRLARERRVLEKQGRALLKLPNKKERSAVEAAEAALEVERKEARAREARHKLTVERLRRQIVELQEKNHEAREEIRWFEAQLLGLGWDGSKTKPPSRTMPSMQAAAPAVTSSAPAFRQPPSSQGAPSAAPGIGGQRGGAVTAGGKPRQSLFPQQPSSRQPASSAAPQAVVGSSTRMHSSPPNMVPPVHSSDQGRPQYSTSLPGGHQSQEGVARQPYGAGQYGHRHDSPMGYAQDDDEEVFEEDQDGGEPDVLSSRPDTFRDSGGVDDRGSAAAPGSLGGGRPDAHRRSESSSWAAMLGLEEGDDDLDEADDGFHPAFAAGAASHRSERELGPPPSAARSHSASNYPEAAVASAKPRSSMQATHVPGAYRQYAQPQAAPRQYAQPQAAPSAGFDQAERVGHTLRHPADSNPRHQQETQAPSYTHTHPQQDLSRNQQQAHPPPHRHPPQTPLLQASSWGGSPDQGGSGGLGGASRGGSDAGGGGTPTPGGTPPLSSVKALAQHLEHYRLDSNPYDFASHPAGSRQEVHERVAVWTQPAGSGQQAASSGYDDDGRVYSSRDSQPSREVSGGGRHSLDGEELPTRTTGYATGQGMGSGHTVSQRLSYEASVAPSRSSGAHLPQNQQPIQQQMSAGVGRGRAGLTGGQQVENLLREVRHADGKHERFYSSGRKRVDFANGTRKDSHPDGRLTIRFANGDVKMQQASGQVGTWHTTHGEGGIEVFYFPGGQTEAHHPDGLKEIVFADGHVRHVMPNGVERDVPPGALSLEVRQPAPQVDMDNAVP